MVTKKAWATPVLIDLAAVADAEFGPNLVWDGIFLDS